MSAPEQPQLSDLFNWGDVFDIDPAFFSSFLEEPITENIPHLSLSGSTLNTPGVSNNDADITGAGDDVGPMSGAAVESMYDSVYPNHPLPILILYRPQHTNP